MITGFLTGSRIYGMPRDDSDLDLCVLVTEGELELLRQCSDLQTTDQEHAEQEAKDNQDRGYPPNGRVLRFGKLNVVCFVHNKHEDAFLSFALGTQKMLASESKGTDNRSQAVATIQSLMNMAIPSPVAVEVSL